MEKILVKVLKAFGCRVVEAHYRDGRRKIHIVNYDKVGRRAYILGNAFLDNPNQSKGEIRKSRFDSHPVRWTNL